MSTGTRLCIAASSIISYSYSNLSDMASFGGFCGLLVMQRGWVTRKRGVRNTKIDWLEHSNQNSGVSPHVFRSSVKGIGQWTFEYPIRVKRVAVQKSDSQKNSIHRLYCSPHVNSI